MTPLGVSRFASRWLEERARLWAPPVAASWMTPNRPGQSSVCPVELRWAAWSSARPQLPPVHIGVPLGHHVMMSHHGARSGRHRALFGYHTPPPVDLTKSPIMSVEVT
jgi:hypothetical protein